MLRFNRMTFIAIAVVDGAWAIDADNRAHADVEGAYSNSTTYSLKITHMPDFDQRRKAAPGIVGLPWGDGGSHCVPNSTMNVFAYISNHGFPNLAPGSGWWQPQSKYNDSGDAINTLGTFMLTDINGTNINDAHIGAFTWLLFSGANITVSSFVAGGNTCPTITNIAQSVASGAIVTFCYGRYLYLGEVLGTDFVDVREGGHCITFAEAIRSGSQFVIKARDPADDPDFDEDDDSYLFSQSMFSNRSYNSPSQRQVTNGSWFRTMTALVYPPPPAAFPGAPRFISLIDSYFVYRPMSGFTWQPGSKGIPQLFLPGLPLNGSPQGSQPSHVLHGFASVDDIALSADLVLGFVLGENKAGQKSLQSVDLVNGEMTLIMQVSAKAMTVGRKQEIYLITDEPLMCVNPYADGEPVEAQVFPPTPCNAICYDDARDEVVLLSPDGQCIYRFPHRFPDGAEPHVTCIPNNVLLEPDEGSIAVNPMDGKAWFVTPASDSIYHVPFHPTCDPDVEQISTALIANPRSISFDDAGKMYVACDAGLMEVMYNDRTGGWEAIPSAYFTGAEVGPKFYVSRSRTNYEEELHGGPEWDNIHPDEIRDMEGTTIEVDCLADLVSSATFQPPPDGVVDAADLAYLLGAWGANDDSAADIVTSATFQPPEDGVIDAADLAFLLGAWGPCS
jgi:hypothetical protein